MGRETEIAWCDSTWSPVRGCTRVSRGCEHCYSELLCSRGLPNLKSPTTGEDFARKTPSGPRWTGRVELIESQLEIPLHWRKPRRIFVNSMSDTFHEALPDEAIDRIFAVMALCPQHTFMVLTKRPKRMQKWFAGCLVDGKLRGGLGKAVQGICGGTYGGYAIEAFYKLQLAFKSWPWPLPNIQLGVSVEDRSTLHRIDQLRETPAALRFLSLEPLLEDLGELDLRGIGWCIVGGESGPGARPCRVEWIRSVVKQCAAAGTSCFVKQLGSRAVSQCPSCDVRKVGPGGPGFCRFAQATRRTDGFDGHGDDGMLPVILRDRMGGDPSEWPERLRVRQMPGEVRR